MLTPLGERLRAWRKLTGITSKKLAELLAVSKVTIWSWEQGKRHPSTRHQAAIDKLLLEGPVTQAPPGQLLKTPTDELSDPCGSVMQAIAKARREIATAAGVEPADVSISVKF